MHLLSVSQCCNVAGSAATIKYKVRGLKHQDTAQTSMAVPTRQGQDRQLSAKWDPYIFLLLHTADEPNSGAYFGPWSAAAASNVLWLKTYTRPDMPSAARGPGVGAGSAAAAAAAAAGTAVAAAALLLGPPAAAEVLEPAAAAAAAGTTGGAVTAAVGGSDSDGVGATCCCCCCC